MLLSRLEINGFKSFPEKTTIEFDGGITGVVGPNGCGKSNILDSIRWVLGEQRTSLLRSSRMEQIIFSGTSTLKPTGMAEVTLFIKNNRGLLPIEYDDVSITRRLYRSGESEYMINRNICRLKDIIELFFDTGIGAHAYSVIQQGMIDSILSDKTEDRRSLFEEAAGVTKYKYRKKEAENKLTATEADLLRIGDVISEIENQVVTLRRQAKRANRYAEQKNRLKEIECAITAGKLFESEKQYGGLSEQKRDLDARIAGIAAEIDKLQVELHENKLALAETERSGSDIRQKEAELTLKAAGFENEIKLSDHRIVSSSEEIRKAVADISSLETRIENLGRSIQESRIKLQETETEKASSAGQCGILERELEDFSGNLNGAESALEAKRAECSALSEKISAVKSEFAFLRESVESSAARLKDLEKNENDFDRVRDESVSSLSDIDNSRHKIAAKIEESKAQIGVQSREKERIARELADSRERLAILQAEKSGLEARRELFEQMIVTGEGYTSGAAALRSWKDAPAGIMLPLAESLEVPEKYRAAVAAALGDMGEIVPVGSYDDAYAAIDYLKSRSLGRCAFLVMDKIASLPGALSRPAGGHGFMGYLDQLAKCPDDYRPAVSLLLGRVGLFDSRNSAVNAGTEWEHCTRVTLDGLVLLPSGFVSGGKISEGVLGRRQDLAAVREKLDTTANQIQQFEASIEANRQSQDNIEGTISGLERRTSDLEDEYNRLDVELNQLRFDFKEKENRYSSAKSEAERLRSERERLLARSKVLEIRQSEYSEDSDRAGRSLKDASGIVDRLRTSIRELETRLTTARIRNVELDGYSNKLRSDMNHNEELCSEAVRMIESNKNNISMAENTVSQSKENIERLKAQLDTCFSERNELKSDLNEINGRVTVLMENISEFEDRISLKRKEKEALVSDLHGLDMRFMELNSARKSAVERIRLEFGITVIEPAALPDDRTIESMEIKAQNIRESLKRMEPVNLMAAEDYERENDRLNFLVRQRDDLLQAKSSLQEAIIRINATAENRFNETFQKISDNFESVFVSLFEGGESKVELEDPSNPLESPIKISARPGGKRMLAVTQLSGGERALTAISLLFGIYLVKPSPFCILDEVDAPLDDANLMRFLKLIKEFSQNTQFIIITHNKLTMEASDILYGVTMQTPGVSKVVSVRFDGNGNGDRELNAR